MRRYDAKTIEELLSNVAKEKQVPESELIYTVVEEKIGSKFFGIGKSVTADVYTMEDVRVFLKSYLEDFFRGLLLEVEVSVEQKGEDFEIMLNADNNAMLIGKNGTTLQAINTVVRSAVNASFKRRFNVVIDINNYKEERYDKLKQIAKRVANTVLRTKVTATLDPMPNDERKIIHQYLSEVRNIKTVSEGEGRNRRLKIMYDTSNNK